MKYANVRDIAEITVHAAKEENNGIWGSNLRLLRYDMFYNMLYIVLDKSVKKMPPPTQ